MGLSPNEFWRLTWYEWGLYCWRQYKRSKAELSKQELHIDMTRRFMLLLARVNGMRDVELQDMLPYKLSVDGNNETEKIEPVSFREAKTLLGSKINKDG